MIQNPKKIFEDNEILIIDKPYGVTVNKSETTIGEKTVQEWIEEKYQRSNIKDQKEGESDFYKRAGPPATHAFALRAGIVHRIDKETSGILVVAKTPEAFLNLQKQFKERRVKKTYLALVHGIVDPPEGGIKVPIGRLPWERKKFGVLAGGREAVTKYKALSIMYQVLGKTKEPLTLLELYPETGRTHQIRVHLKYINHPIFSDYLYAGRKTSRDDRKILPRVFLHASKISFYHPISGNILTFESPLPKELSDFLKTLS